MSDFQETSFDYDESNPSHTIHNENILTRSRSVSTLHTKSCDLPSIRTYHDYDISSNACSCQHRTSLSVTRSGYTKYREPKHRICYLKLQTKNRLHIYFFGVSLLVGVLLLIFCLVSLLFEPKIPDLDLEDEPISELVLVLNTLAPENMPVVISFNGSWRTVHEFQYAQLTGAYQACSALLNGTFYVFGGLTTVSFYNTQPRFEGLNGQISKLTNCSTLERVGDMTFHSQGGACKTFGSVILLCFDFKNPSTCHSFDGEKFTRRDFIIMLYVQARGI